MNSRIQRIRKDAKMSQAEFGAAIGISGPAVSKIESGTNTPSESTLRMICNTFNIRYNWLVTGEGEMSQYLDTDALVDKYMAGESEFAKSIMKGFAKMPYDEWVKFRDKMEQIRKEAAW